MKGLRRLAPFLRPYVGLIVASCLLAIPLAALRVGPVPIVQYFVDDLLVSKDHSKVYLYPLLIIGLFVLNFGVRFLHYYCIRVVVGRVDQQLKNRLHEHLMGLSADHFAARSAGSLISRIGHDPQYISSGINCITILVREPITLVMLLAYTLTINWQLTLIVFGLVPPLAWVFAVTGRNLKRYIHQMTEANGRLFSIIQESLVGIRVVQAFRLEKYVRKKFREQSDEYARIYLKTAVLEEAAHPMVELLTGIAIGALLFFGGRQLVAGEMTAGGFMGFLTAFALTLNPIRTLNDLNIKLNQTAAATDRIFQTLGWKSSLAIAADPKRCQGVAKDIRLENVRFAYPDDPEQPILRGISFEIPRGGVVALVGASGAGKSSLVNLLPRLFDVNEGAIRIDGTDIKQFDVDSLRAQFAVVSQDVFLFNDSIEENIRCGRLSATREEIREAARRAHADEFIREAPQGYDTVIGDRGQKLSGGERQRLSIARAFLRKAPILILDEATSNLDTRSELMVQEALTELMKDRTTIVIAHRLSTIRHADRIHVLKDGQIIESGKHDELLARGGTYAALYRGQ